MSDSDNDDIFDRIASEKFMGQAGLTDGVTTKPVQKKPVKQVKQECGDSDSDLEDLANEVANIDTKRLALLQQELQRWEKVRTQARSNGVDPTRIAKVDKKIKEIKDELQRSTATSHAQDKEVQKLEREIEELEAEKLALDQKISAHTIRLRQLRPHKTSDDWLNDPNQLGGRVVGGKFVEDEDDEEEDHAALYNHMMARRKLAESHNQYNASTGHVKIKNPEPTRDTNVGF